MRPLTTLAALVLSVAGPVAPAALADTPLTPLETGDEARGWNAVGQLDLDGRGFCTAALIAPDQVLTAAHCVFDPETGKIYTPDKLRFLAGWRNGSAAAYRAVRRLVVHPDYHYNTRNTVTDVNYDLALLQLERPIRLPSIAPYAIGAAPGFGTPLEVVSYAKGRARAPSLQRTCHVLGRRESVVVMTCSVDFGASGAPVFTMRDGELQVVSVVSAKAQMRGKPVSLGIAVDGPLQTLEGALKRAENGMFLRVPAMPGLPPAGLAAGGAKFVRP